MQGVNILNLQQVKTNWYFQTQKSVIEHLITNPVTGLNNDKATQRLAKYGENKLEVKKREHWHQILARQFIDVLIDILIVAAAMLSLFVKP